MRCLCSAGFNAIESGSSAPRYSLTSNLGVSLGIGGGHASLGNTPPMARSRSSIISRLYSRHPFSRNVQIGGLVGGVGGSGHLSDTEMPARKATDGYFSDTEYTNRRRFPALLFLSQKLAAQSAAAHASSGEIDNLDHSQPTQSLANSATGSNRNLFQSLFGGGTSSAGAGTTVAGPANLTLASSGNEISAGAESICGNESGRSNIRRLSLYELVRFGDYKLRRKQTTNRRKTDKESDRNQAMVDNRDAIDAAMARPMNTNGISGHHPLLSSTYGVDSNSASLTLPQDPLRCPLADSLRMQLLRNELIASGGVANAAHGNFQVIAETSQEDQESVPSVDNLDGNSISVNQTRSGQQQRQQLFVAHSRGSRSSLTSQRRRSRSRSHSSREELPPDRLGETVSGHEKPQSIVTYLDAGNFLNANTNELPLRRLSAPSAADRPNGSALAVNRNNLLPLSARTLRTSESADSARVHRTGSNTQINGTRKLSLELCVPQIMINDQEQQSAEIQTNSTTHYPWIDEGGRSVINATADLSQQKSQTAQKSTGTTPWLPNQQSADVERTNLARSECNLSTSAFNWANSPSNLDPSEMTKATRPITGSVGPTPKSVSITRTRSGEKRHEAKERRERLLALRRLNSIQPYPIAFDRSGSMLEPPAVTQNTRHLQSVAKSLDELEFRQMNTSTLPGSIESGQLLSATNVAIDQTAVRSLSPDQRRTLSCGGGPGANTSAVTGRKNWPVAVGDGSLQWQRRRSSSESDCDTGHLFRSIRMQSFQHDAPPPRSQLMDAFGPYFNFQSNMSNNDTNASDVNTSNAANNRRSVPPSNMRRSARFRCRSNLEGAELVTPFSSGAMFTHDQWSDTENSTHRSAQQLDHFHCPPPQYYLHDNLIDPTQSMQSYQERHQESTLQHHHSLHHRLLSTHQLHHPSLPAHHDHSGDRSIDALRSPSTAPTFEPHPDLYSEVLEAYPGHTASRRHRDALVRSLSFSRSDSALAIRCALAAGCGSAPLDDAQLSSPNSQCESNRLSRRRYRQVSAVASRQISEQQVRETASRLSSWPATIQPGVSSNLIGDQWAKSVDQISKSSSSFDSSESSSSIDRQ